MPRTRKQSRKPRQASNTRKRRSQAAADKEGHDSAKATKGASQDAVDQEEHDGDEQKESTHAEDMGRTSDNEDTLKTQKEETTDQHQSGSQEEGEDSKEEKRQEPSQTRRQTRRSRELNATKTRSREAVVEDQNEDGNEHQQSESGQEEQEGSQMRRETKRRKTTKATSRKTAVQDQDDDSTERQRSKAGEEDQEESQKRSQTQRRKTQKVSPEITTAQDEGEDSNKHRQSDSEREQEEEQEEVEVSQTRKQAKPRKPPKAKSQKAEVQDQDEGSNEHQDSEQEEPHQEELQMSRQTKRREATRAKSRKTTVQDENEADGTKQQQSDSEQEEQEESETSRQAKRRGVQEATKARPPKTVVQDQNKDGSEQQQSDSEDQQQSQTDRQANGRGGARKAIAAKSQKTVVLQQDLQEANLERRQSDSKPEERGVCQTQQSKVKQRGGIRKVEKATPARERAAQDQDGSGERQQSDSAEHVGRGRELDSQLEGDEVNRSLTKTVRFKDHEHTDLSPPKASRRKESRQLLRNEVESLHKEMEVAQHAIYKGNFKRKLPRWERTIRAKKRRLLENQDRAETEQVRDDSRHRMRGSKAAAEDHVVEGSLIFTKQDDEAGPLMDSEADFTTAGEEDSDDAEEESGNEDGSEEDNGDDLIAPPKDDGEVEKGRDGSSKVRRPRQRSISRKRSQRNKRRLYRLRDFKSFRMAQRHGEALGAHVRGKPQLAIAKLKSVARDAPSAPQIYSSLGLVYEDMLRDTQRKENEGGEVEEEEVDGEAMDSNNVTGFDPAWLPNKNLTMQFEYAKKAYGALHVAAVLCKRDYHLFVRAADMACEIADLHRKAIALPSLEKPVRDAHREELKRWMHETKNDYQAADNLKPPGIDVPAKLASILLEVGCLSEALTLLTSLKNMAPTADGCRSEFESSYKGWILYSDLMLRIGFECEKWNSGDESNSNYMFRRWLRKWSKSFDWRERRIQALAKALEAAAGTKATFPLLAWLEYRAKHGRSDEPIISDKERYGATGGTSTFEIDQRAELEEERDLLARQKEKDLENFDKTTSDMGLEKGSIAETERQKSRKRLIERLHHETYTAAHGNKDASTDASEVLAMVQSLSKLPLLASVATVCRIGLDLMRALLEKGLFEGAKSAGESISDYLKERAMMREKRLQLRERLDNRQKLPTSDIALRTNKHDTFDAYMDDDESDLPLSDDDLMDRHQEAGVLDSMKKGTLPPDLLVLYGISLASLGNRNYLALKCIQQGAALLEQEDLDWLQTEQAEVDEIEENWACFRKKHEGSFGRTVALSVVAFVFSQQTKRDKRLTDGLAHIFTEQEGRLQEAGLINGCCDVNRHSPPLQLQRRAIIVSLLEAAVDYKVNKMEQSQADILLMRGLLHSISNVTKVLPSFWTSESDEKSSGEVSLLKTCSRAFLLLSKHCNTDPEGKFVNDLMNDLKSWMATIFSIDSVETSELTTAASNLKIDNLPMCAEWQSLRQASISVRCFNHAIATNVANFAGWRDREFVGTSDEFVRHSVGFSSATTTDGQVAGVLGAKIENELREQWRLLTEDTQDFVGCSKVPSQFDSLPGSSMQYLREKKTKYEENNKVALYGEDHALVLLVTYSRLSLVLSSKDSAKRLDALSVMLPLSQFVLNKKLWTSPIGDKAEARGTGDWGRLPLNRDRASLRPSERPGYVRPGRKAATENPKNDHRYHWLDGEDEDEPLSNLIALNPHDLEEVWRKTARSTLALGNDPSSSEAMGLVHNAIWRLRMSFTEEALERASLVCAASLLRVCLYPDCRNGFLCFQLAAMYAAQGAKAGNNDSMFKHPIPSKEECSAHEALVILCRADCLQAIHFAREAAFLCGFVFSVCSLHRNSSNYEWDETWSIVSISAYNVSVHTRYAMDHLVHFQDRRMAANYEWDSEVMEEMHKARYEGLKMIGEMPPVENEIHRLSTGVQRTNGSCKSVDEADGRETPSPTEASKVGKLKIPGSSQLAREGLSVSQSLEIGKPQVRSPAQSPEAGMAGKSYICGTPEARNSSIELGFPAFNTTHMLSSPNDMTEV